jgi:hypothetical protein
MLTGTVPRGDGPVSGVWMPSGIIQMLNVLTQLLEDMHARGVVLRKAARLVQRVPSSRW